MRAQDDRAAQLPCEPHLGVNDLDRRFHLDSEPAAFGLFSRHVLILDLVPKLVVWFDRCSWPRRGLIFE